jgi:broad specificity phosphatase PhoE
MLLIRHGETEANLNLRYHGRHDSPLTERGVAQATAIGRLVRMQPEATSAMMISSPQPRARRTAELVRYQLEKPTIPIQLDERLCEVSIGGWEGLSQQEISQLAPGTFEGEERHGWCFRAPGGESYDVFEGRIRDWLSEATKNPSVIVVTHGIVARVLRGLYSGLPSSAALALPIPQDKIFRLSNGAFEELDVEVGLKMPRIVKVTPLTALHLLVEFDDGVTGRIDIGKQLSHGIETFRDAGVFQQVTIDDFGAVCWPTGFALSPDTAYDLARSQPTALTEVDQ